jgi:hypothetical protein
VFFSLPTLRHIASLLVHVLDEISSLKDAMYQNTRHDSRRSTRGAKGKRRHVLEESDDESGDSEAEEEKSQKKSVSSAAAAATPIPRRGIDFSNCF